MPKFAHDLRWYLFEEYANILRKDLGNEYCTNYLNNLKRLNKSYNKLKIVLDALKIYKKITGSFSCKSNYKKNILVHNTLYKYPSIISKLSESYNIISVGESLESLFYINNVFKNIYFPLYPIYKEIYSGIINHDEDQLHNCLNNLREIFKKLNPDLIVLNQDAHPESRALILIAKELKVPIIEIQHGIYPPKYIETGEKVDYVFVWGEYFKNLYLKYKIKPSDKLKILGYPYEFKNNNLINNKTKKIIYYLGQNFEACGEDLINIKAKTINFLNNLCRELGYDFIYRPHPSDNIKLLRSKFSYVKFTPNNESLSDSIEKGDIFISFNSTSLIEASLKSKLSLQLKNYDFPADDFGELGICQSSFNNLEELGSYLKEIAYKNNLSDHLKSFNRKYIEIPMPDPGTRFLELLNEINVR